MCIYIYASITVCKLPAIQQTSEFLHYSCFTSKIKYYTTFIFSYWKLVRMMNLMSFLSIISLLFDLIMAVDHNLETYIIHVEAPDLQLATDMVDLDNWYLSFLPTTTTTTVAGFSEESQQRRLVYSYHNVFKGFAARLSKEEVKEMEKKKGFISAQPQQILSLHTTRSPNFLGLTQNSGMWKYSNYGKGVIIGVLDSGIEPRHPSFSGEGIPPPPDKWKGRCQYGFATMCNNKLIGARYFMRGLGFPLDDNGHGTHTASTAAGNYVKGANVYGNVNGTASGVAPLAHLAIYKVCSNMGCAESDLVAAMDAAIEDGVDVISLSLGGASRPFYMDSIAISAFSAVERGIFVAASAGNRGPSASTLTNEAPWILNVGASTIDRKTISIAKLGNNDEYEGQSVYQPTTGSHSSLLPLIYPGPSNTTSYCLPGSLDNIDIKRKIVVCLEGGGISPTGKGRQVKAAGGAGMILINRIENGYTITEDPQVLPSTHLSYAHGLKVLAYMKSTSSPTATILFRGTSISDRRAPVVASFSSRGPNGQSLGILKPDIIGPGVNIMAAWPVSVEDDNDSNINSRSRSRSNFNIISGTSMSCPHLSGVAALLKSAHPNWSPAVIRSAIITTADTVNFQNNPIEDEMQQSANIFAMGAGHVNPSKAYNPGLVYDIQSNDYISYLCGGLNYTDMQVASIAQRAVDCSMVSSIPEAQLNYPSFSVFLGESSSDVQRYTRTVTNVGDDIEKYNVQVVEPRGVSVIVEPTMLSFSRRNQRMKYAVTFKRLTTNIEAKFAEGSVSWKSEKHSVRSPVVAIFNALT